MEKIEVFIKNLQPNELFKFSSSINFKVGILINRFVQFAGSETKQPGRNLSWKLKIVPNYPILRYSFLISDFFNYSNWSNWFPIKKYNTEWKRKKLILLVKLPDKKRKEKLGKKVKNFLIQSSVKKITLWDKIDKIYCL